MSASNVLPARTWPRFRGLWPVWLPPMLADLGAWRLDLTPLGALLVHVALFILIFRWWHQAVHHPATGRLNRQHRIHHEQNYPPERFTSARYLADPGFAQEAALVGGLVSLLVASWALGTPLMTLALAGGMCTGTLVFGATLHRAQHVSPHPWERYAWFRHLRTLHLRHHEDVRVNYGIADSAYDAVFGTLRE